MSSKDSRTHQRTGPNEHLSWGPGEKQRRGSSVRTLHRARKRGGAPHTPRTACITLCLKCSCLIHPEAATHPWHGPSTHKVPNKYGVRERIKMLCNDNICAHTCARQWSPPHPQVLPLQVSMLLAECSAQIIRFPPPTQFCHPRPLTIVLRFLQHEAAFGGGGRWGWGWNYLLPLHWESKKQRLHFGISLSFGSWYERRFLP